MFIFAAGWRSGSTLLQRLVMSSGSIFIWGEPYSHSGLIDHLSSPVKAITDIYPETEWFMGDNISDPSVFVNDWCAHLYPDINYLIESHIAFITNLFEKPAKEKGVLRWGLKDVRLTIDHAIYLNWLFPQAKFIFLYRNPYKTYASFRGSYWYTRWPTDPVYTPKRFGMHWKMLLEGYIAGHQKVNTIVVKYEDLVEGNFDFDALEEFLALKLDKNVLQIKVGSSMEFKSNEVTSEERRILKMIVEPLASQLGYKYNES